MLSDFISIYIWLHLHSLLVGCAPNYFNVPGALKAGMPPTSHCCATSVRRFQRYRNSKGFELYAARWFITLSGDCSLAVPSN